MSVIEKERERKRKKERAGGKEKEDVDERHNTISTIMLFVYSLFFHSALYLTRRMTAKAEEESKPVVGSSKNSTAGLATSSTPIVTRFRISGETADILPCSTRRKERKTEE